MKLFQWCLGVVRSEVGVETGILYVRLSITTVIFNCFISFLFGIMLQTIWQQDTLQSWEGCSGE